MSKKKIFIIFPHQLFEDIEKLRIADEIYLVEEYLFFNQYKFHKQKLVFHRATMKFYENFLSENKLNVNYIEAKSKENDIRILLESIFKKHQNEIEIYHYDVCDNWLSKRIFEFCNKNDVQKIVYDSKLFLNSEQEIKEYFGKKNKYFQTDFYIQQRKRLNILVDEQKNPVGEKWSFDTENRAKYSIKKVPPKLNFPNKNQFYVEAIHYIETNFHENLGEISSQFIYPCSFEQAKTWLKDFLNTRFYDFGEFEDAIVNSEIVLHHSLLTPMMNVGLLTPRQIIDETLAFATREEIPLNSLEGFIRQIIGWREFIRGVYVMKGTKERTTNFWKFDKKIPSSFYDGTTGITPLDDTIKKVLNPNFFSYVLYKSIPIEFNSLLVALVNSLRCHPSLILIFLISVSC